MTPIPWPQPGPGISQGPAGVRKADQHRKAAGTRGQRVGTQARGPAQCAQHSHAVYLRTTAGRGQLFIISTRFLPTLQLHWTRAGLSEQGVNLVLNAKVGVSVQRSIWVQRPLRLPKAPARRPWLAAEAPPLPPVPLTAVGCSASPQLQGPAAFGRDGTRSGSEGTTQLQRLSAAQHLNCTNSVNSNRPGAHSPPWGSFYAQFSTILEKEATTQGPRGHQGYASKPSRRASSEGQRLGALLSWQTPDPCSRTRAAGRGSPGRGWGTGHSDHSWAQGTTCQFLPKGFLKSWGRGGWENHTDGLQNPQLLREASFATGKPPYREETQMCFSQQNRAVFLDSSKIFPVRT